MSEVLRDMMEVDELYTYLLNKKNLIITILEFMETPDLILSNCQFKTLKCLLFEKKMIMDKQSQQQRTIWVLKKQGAEYLTTNFETFFSAYNKLVKSQTHIVRRQSLKLLADILLAKEHNKHNMVRYVGDKENLKNVFGAHHRR
eukprot:UN28005